MDKDLKSKVRKGKSNSSIVLGSLLLDSIKKDIRVKLDHSKSEKTDKELKDELKELDRWNR
jgi:hypothetical protein